MFAARLALLLLGAVAASAHVGSPDVFFEGDAGPYKLLIAIRPPTVIPGVAEVEVRSLSPDVTTVRVMPLPLTGDGAKHPPTPDVAERSKDDPQFYTGTLWLMGFGSWQVRVEAEGAKGTGQLSVPVPAIASNTKGMQKQLGAALFGVMLFLVFGLVSIVGASVREARLRPGVAPEPSLRRRSYLAMAFTSALTVAILYAGYQWWNSDAAAYRAKVYRPLEMTVALERANRLTLDLKDTGWFFFRALDDLVPDHNHLMHLFAIRMPEMDRMWHLHPEQREAGTFALDLPAMPAGRYKLFADIVHASGLAETATAVSDLPAIAGRALSGDDATGEAPPLSQADPNRVEFPLPRGYRMAWLRDPAPLAAKRLTLFRFELRDPQGKPASDVELYMGMAGHAEFVRADGNVFAHVHPAGSVSMAAVEMAGGPPMTGMDAMHSMPGMIPAPVSFPYGFPGAGRYRIFVQMKRAGEIVTGVFDATAI